MSTRFRLVPRGPFNLLAAREYFGGWAAMAGEPETILMAFPVEGWRGSAAVVVRQPSDGAVEADVHGEDAEHAWRQAQAALSLDYDGSGYPDVGKRDPVIGRLQSEHHMLRPVCFHSPYEAACSFVIGHRISITQARALRNRLAEAHGDAISVGGETLHAFPRPQVLLELESFAQIAGEKMERVHGIAEAALSGTLDRELLRSLPREEAVTQLRKLRGVGAFIAEGIYLRGAGVADEVPNDEVTRQGVQQAYDLNAEPDSATMLRIAETWRPYRMWCSVLVHLALRRSGASFRSRAR